MSEASLAAADGGGIGTEESLVWDALRRVDDPEVGINLVDLGLVYGVAVNEREVAVRLTMTSPACPLGDAITAEAERAIRAALPRAGRIEIALVWEPPWTPERMSAAARRKFDW